MARDILIIDSDTLNLELLVLPRPAEQLALFFIWDESLFEKRHFSQMRREFIYEALRDIKNLTLIVGESQSTLVLLKKEYSECEIFYASAFDDRFESETLSRIFKRDKVEKIEPLPRGFFSFYKKLIHKKERSA